MPSGISGGASVDLADYAKIADVIASDFMVFKGVINCSANPNYPDADRGHTYRVSVAGKIGGGSGPNVEVGDLLICLNDSTLAGTQAGVGSSWSIEQANIDGAVIGPTSVTASDFAQFDGTTGKLLKAGLSLDTDATMAADSDVRVASQKAVAAKVATIKSFSTISVSGQSNVVADVTADTLTLIAGNNVTITTDAAADSVTIMAAGGGGGSTPNSAMFASTADGTNNALASDTSITGTGVGSKTTAANYFSVGTSLMMVAKGTVSTAVTPDNLTIKIKAGSVVIASATGVSLTGALSSSQWEILALITCRTAGASAVFKCNSLFAVTGTTLTPLEAKLVDTGTSVDGTATIAWDLTAVWASTTAGDTITGTNFLMWTPGNGVVATDAIFTAKGDLAVGTAANASAKLAVGANGTIAVADSSQATGIRWGQVGFADAPMGVPFIASVAGVNLKTAGTTTVFTVPAGKTFICQSAFALVTAVTGGGAGTQTFKITESGTGAQMVPNTVSPSATPLVGYVYLQSPAIAGSPWTSCAAGNNVQVVVATSHAGSTTVTGTVYVMGFYY